MRRERPISARTQSGSDSRAWALHTALAVCAGALSGGRSCAGESGRAAAIAPYADGVAPWPGEVSAREVALSLPADAVRASDCASEQDAWRFEGRTRAHLASLAREARLSDEATRSIVDEARCDRQGCTVTPTMALLDALTPTSRAVLYPELARHQANREHVDPALRPTSLGAWSDEPELSTRVAGLLAAGTWSTGRHYAFSDSAWLCARLSDSGERLAALRALRARYTLDAWVRVPFASDVDAVVAHWSRGRDAEVRARFEGAVARGERVSVASLLPAMARARLARYPAADEPPSDGFWTAAHFFDTDPAPERLGVSAMDALLRERYVEVPLMAGRYGDLVALYDPVGELVQTASLVAIDLVFVKDGDERVDPWVLEHMSSFLARHRFTTPRLWRAR